LFHPARAMTKLEEIDSPPVYRRRAFHTSARPDSFCPHDHRLIIGQQLDLYVTETSLAHPANAIGASETEAGFGHDQHVQAIEQTRRTESSGVINQSLIHDESAPCGQCIISFFQQHLLGHEVPIM